MKKHENAEKCIIICICQKKAVPLQPILSRSSSYLASLERFTTRGKNALNKSSRVRNTL